MLRVSIAVLLSISFVYELIMIVLWLEVEWNHKAETTSLKNSIYLHMQVCMHNMLPENSHV